MIRFRGGKKSAEEFKEALMDAKDSIDYLCQLSEEMLEEYGQNDGVEYGQRMSYGQRSNGAYGEPGNDFTFRERRSRNSMGRYR